MSRAVSRSGTLLLGALLVRGLASVAAFAAESDPLEALTRRLDDARGALARRPLGDKSVKAARAERAAAQGARRLETLALLDAQASELDGYAATAPVESASIARARAVDSRLEALALALAESDGAVVGSRSNSTSTESTLTESTSSVTSNAPPSRPTIASLWAALAAAGPDASTRAFALRLASARSQGDAAGARQLLNERLLAHAPEVAAVVKAHAGRVLVLVLTRADDADDSSSASPKFPSRAQRSDEAERQALVAELGPRGLDVATTAGARALGATGRGLELVLDRTSRVRGVDLTGAERKALVRALLEDPTGKTGE